MDVYVCMLICYVCMLIPYLGVVVEELESGGDTNDQVNA